MKLYTRGMFLFVCVLIGNGCAQEIAQLKGAKALVYLESHTYQFTLTPKMEPVEAEIERIIRDAKQIDYDVNVTINYRSQQGKALVQRQLAKWHLWGISSQQIRSQYRASLTSDVSVELTLTRILTEICQPREIEQPVLRRGCFVDTLRMKQVARPVQYMGEQ